MAEMPIIEFPAWRYHHASGRSIVVDGPEADANLKTEPGWTDEPPQPPELTPLSAETEAGHRPPPHPTQLPAEPPHPTHLPSRGEEEEKPDRRPRK